MQPLRVAMDMTFPSRSRSGVGVYARRLVEALGRRDDVTVEEISGPARSGIPGTLRWLAGGARRTMEARRPDLLHCPGFVAPWSVTAPVVVTVHDAATRRYGPDHPLEWRFYDRVLMPGRLRAAARVIAVSEFSRREIIDVYGMRPDRVVAVPEGVDQRYFEIAPNGGGNGAHGNMLFPGAPLRRKNLETVLRCMAHADPESQLGRASLDISGARAEDFQHHAALARQLGIEARVRWLGQVPADDYPRLVAGASVVVYPSLYEGFGFPPLEAMAVGTPVVASNRASLPEVLGDAALQVDPTDGRALGQAIESVLTSAGVREGLRERGRRWARRFSWDRCAELTCEVYRDAMREEQRT